MNRRKALKITAGAVAGSGAGLLVLTNAFKPAITPLQEPQLLNYQHNENNWKYTQLDPDLTAELAYKFYPEGSCMYATVKSIISQLAEKTGEPFRSFPVNLFKYGHGGVGGYGSICGALNGAAAMTGLLISDNSARDKIIADIFRWHENEALPEFAPLKPSNEYIPVKSTSNSILCHASNTNWCKLSGFKVNSNERKERCKRMTADVAKKLALTLNETFSGSYTTSIYKNETVNTCLTCHGSTSKLNNSSVQMGCDPCHTESPGHRVFSDLHYKLMKE